MCRLLAYASIENATVQSVLTPEEFATFRSLSTLHGDGWGGSWLTGLSATPVRFNSVLPATEDQDFLRIISESAGSAGIVHLRWATSGFPVCLENTHPFTEEDWSFAHNGAFDNPKNILHLLSAERRSRLRGDTDSELYFQLILQRMEELGDAESGLRRAIADVRTHCGLGSLNCLMLNSRYLIAVQAQGATPAPISSLIAAVGGSGGVPEGHNENYYKLRYAIRDGLLVVGSTGLGEEGWTELGDDAVISVNLSSKHVHITPLSETGSVQKFNLYNYVHLA
jgi:predicted glutamine amidotransferase